MSCCLYAERMRDRRGVTCLATEKIGDDNYGIGMLLLATNETILKSLATRLSTANCA